MGAAHETEARPAPQKRRGRTSSTTKAKKTTSPDSPPSRRASTSTDGEPSQDKKTRLRQRNREAAQKCRRRKQRGIDELQNQEAAAGSLHDALASEAAQLKGEVVMLKGMILQHGACGCSFIEEYIQGQAASLAHAQAAVSPGVFSDGSGGADVKPDPGVVDRIMSAEGEGLYGPGVGGMGYAHGETRMPGQSEWHGGDGDVHGAAVPRDAGAMGTVAPFSLDMDRSIGLHA